MRRVHEAYIAQDGLIPTLWSLGIRGILSPGALSWQTYPIARVGVTLLPGLIDAVDGSPVGLIPPNAIDHPYMLTHLNVCETHRSGGRIGRWKLQDLQGNNLRVFRFQNPAKNTGGNNFGTSVVEGMLPLRVLSDSGVQIRAAIDNNSFDIIERCYLTAMIGRPTIVPSLLTVTPTALGAVLPTTAAGTVATNSATVAWDYGNYVQLTAGLGTGALITALVFSSASFQDGQITFATGAAASEVDWGTFGWAEPFGSNVRAARYSLYPFPFYLPASTRLAARARGEGPSNTWNVGIEYIPIPLR